MVKIITFANQKGGVGKTSTSHVVSVGLARKGYKVLACDLDPQANLTAVLGINPEGDIVSIYELFEKQCDIEDAIVTTEHGVDLLVGSLMMFGSDRKYQELGDEYILKKALSKVSDNYDFIIIDTPPSLGIMSLNALTVTDYLTVIMTPDYFSKIGIKQFKDTVATVRKNLNSNIKINGILITMYDRTNITSIINEDMEEIAQKLDTKIYNSKIRRAVPIRESQYMESSIFNMKDTGILDDYNAFINEILKEVQS